MGGSPTTTAASPGRWRWRRARTVGLGATGFAIAGFLLGLNFTARGGHLPDVAYHVVMLPVLIGGLVALLRSASD